MNKTALWYAAVLLVVYFTLVFCEESSEQNENIQLVDTSTNTDTNVDTDMDSLINAGRDLLEFEGRTRRHRHRFWYRHLWPLAIAYWIKVKVVIVSFFVGSAIYLGLRYFWPHARGCNHEIILDHPPPSFTHDHIPYSLDHHEHEHEHYDGPSYDSSPSFEPYSGYSGYSASSDIVSDYSSDPSSPPTGPSGPTGSSDTRRRGRRSAEPVEVADKLDYTEVEKEHVEIIDEEGEIAESEARQQAAEEQIAEFMFAFLGLDSKACRRRFVCEMEFRSNLNPLTSMAFRIVGRGFFEKYTNSRNPQSRATNFFECASANPECVFVENADPEITAAEPENSPAEPESTENAQKTDEEQHTEQADESENEVNLQAERRHAQLRHRRGDRKLSSIAEHILTQ
ncbi:hypothetical protein KR222_006027 [Zaprionus bogoriensis]|nr:hypothetical protein KR222_006027 [Zaprionus bogoriensis]